MHAAANIAGMKITFKLFASLGDYLPASVRPANEMSLPVAEGATNFRTTSANIYICERPNYF